jgi:sugar phosphate isomerase/epimerase
MISSPARVTMLNNMADPDIVRAIERLAGWGVRDLDLRSQIFGKQVAGLGDEDCGRVAELARSHGMAIHCLSSHLFFDDKCSGEAHFRAVHLAAIPRLIAVARILRPRMIRLLAARSSRPFAAGNRVAAMDRDHPWLMPLYGEAIDALHDAGFQVTIENEVWNCVMTTAEEVLSFFARLGRRDRCSFTWDIQNLWEQSGVMPSLETYQRLRHLIGYVHFKGGRTAGDGSPRLRWSSTLEEASWPVREIARAASADGVSPVLCLNPSHGERAPGRDDAHAARRDLVFLTDVLLERQASAGR